ncbi:peroxiredoxin [Neorhizobium galegae]|uniref:peroxiredoxin n=1 Tax=Neorhizobium galegae TaxID=399 RepID=UPI000621916F|nr:peroxiredoxin [Neorhizobium galegae]CDZ27475.1 Bacterioferritin comigratory protein [Neorhizobium galegae bv. officinalis]KAA9387186.1 peroxiredoxin [Neorhizobium galegae]KAB1114332.1 peroxiredoxin [Neorhizobium galegae]MCM2497441.1 peroxiredoxin [Neorhizobium galegae]MCQ1771531.1 peroxiredoxin [Neorhizobium galegae]
MGDLTIGDIAPDFELPRDGGGTVSLKTFSGKPVVLYFYPKDDTEACTKEAISFTGLLPEFEKAGAPVIGVSPDSVKKHDKFAKKHGLSVILAADEDTALANLYGVWKEKSMYGRTYMGVERTTFLIGADGRIARIWPKVKVAGHAEEVLESLKAL